MAYTVKRRDTLSAIYRGLGYRSWQDLWNANRSIIGNNPHLIYPGQVYKSADESGYYGGGSQSSSSSVSVSGSLPPSTQIAQSIAQTVSQPKLSFTEKYGTIDAMRPDAMFRAAAEQKVNPEMLRESRRTMQNADMKRVLSGTAGGYSGRALYDREELVNSLERQRKEAINEYVQAQNQMFTDWYGREMKAYGEAKDPSSYQLNKFGVEGPWNTGEVYTYNPSNQKKLDYFDAVNMVDVFGNMGGYLKPSAMYNKPVEYNALNPGAVGKFYY